MSQLLLFHVPARDHIASTRLVARFDSVLALHLHSSSFSGISDRNVDSGRLRQRFGTKHSRWEVMMLQRILKFTRSLGLYDSRSSNFLSPS